MSAIFTVLLFVIFLAVVASLYPEGMWGNALQLVNVSIAALLATNYFEPLANWLEGLNASAATYKYVWDFLSIWALFAVFLVVLRATTDTVSRVKVRFLKIADQVGSVLFSCLVALVVVSFVTFSLHLAPLGKSFMWEGFDPDKPAMLGLAPDQKWISLVRHLSDGAFSCSPPRVFDQDSQFRANYAQRRAAIGKHIADTGKLRTN